MLALDDVEVRLRALGSNCSDVDGDRFAESHELALLAVDASFRSATRARASRSPPAFSGAPGHRGSQRAAGGLFVRRREAPLGDHAPRYRSDLLQVIGSTSRDIITAERHLLGDAFHPKPRPAEPLNTGRSTCRRPCDPPTA